MSGYGFTGGRHIFISDLPKGLSFEQRAKAVWDMLQGARNEVDYRRAELLDEAFDHYDCSLKDDDGLEPLEALLNDVLDVPKGKRTKKFIRMAVAFQTISDFDTWYALGGLNVVLLTRVDGRRRSRIMKRVHACMSDRRSNGTYVSCHSFRRILVDVLGQEDYEAILLEPGTGRKRNRARPQLRTLRAFVLKQAAKLPELEKAIRRSPKVRNIVYPPSLR